MLSINQKLRISQRISPQQIQFIKLLQVPTTSLEQRIKEEIEGNPALEDPQMGINDKEEEEDKNEDEDPVEEIPEDYLFDIKTRLPQNRDPNEDVYQAPMVNMPGLLDMLKEQLSMLRLTEHEKLIGEYIVGSIDEEGYLSSRGTSDPVKSIAGNMAFRDNISVTPEEVEAILEKIQRFDPAGVGARNLQECMVLQLKRKKNSPEVELALKIIEKHFDEFSKKHFSKLQARLGISEEKLREVYGIITHLNPKPGESQTVIKHNQIIPDFLAKVEEGEIRIFLNNSNAPDLKVSRRYQRMYQEHKQDYKKSKNPDKKETADFIKKSINSAQWFIDAIKQRQFTLLNTMEAIAEEQKEFFLFEGDEKKLRPMILKDIAEKIGMDISTISRVANSKYVETDFGIFPLKYFFSEGIETEDGMVSNREVKRALQEIVEEEDKQKPLSDDRLAAMLKERGYNIARRTVAKYREQLDLPVARLRKEV